MMMKKNMDEGQHKKAKRKNYLPRGYLNDLYYEFRNTVAYRVWQRKLKKFGSIRKKPSFRLLEVGCGAGYFLRFIEKKYPICQSFGADFDEQSVQYASTWTERSLFVCHDGHFLPYLNSSFEVVSSLQVLEHLAHPELLFNEAYRVLKLGGLFIYSTPNPRGLAARINKKNWRGFREDHISLKTLGQWRTIAERAGFHILEDGTTALTGLRIMNIFPFAVINWIPMMLFGYFSWELGGSYMAVSQKKTKHNFRKSGVT